MLKHALCAFSCRDRSHIGLGSILESSTKLVLRATAHRVSGWARPGQRANARTRQDSRKAEVWQRTERIRDRLETRFELAKICSRASLVIRTI